MVECKGCGRPITHSRILGWVHADDGSYWCYPHDLNDLTIAHASDTQPFMVLDCDGSRQRYGY